MGVKTKPCWAYSCSLPINHSGRESMQPNEFGDLRGIFPVVYTPFDSEGRIDEGDLERLVEHLIASGADGLAAVGGASEAHKMTVAERMRLAERTMSFAQGRVPVVVG